MSNIKRLAPYIYFAKRNDASDKYDLFLLVPVDLNGDAGLADADVSREDARKIVITYPTTNNAANVVFRTRRFEIQGDQDLVSVEIKDENEENVMVINIADADEAEGNQNANEQTCAPYLFAEIETAGPKAFGKLSCVLLEENNAGVLSESIAFSSNQMNADFYVGSGNSPLNPGTFLVNQDIKVQLEQNVPFTFESNVTASVASGKPPRKNKVQVLW